MKIETQGIILWYLRYGENSVISHIYTEEYGRQAFIFKGIKSAKGRQKFSFLQPLSLVRLPIDYRPNKELYTGNGAHPFHVMQSIPFQQVKNSVAFFLAELLSKVLQAHEADAPLFRFLKESILLLDNEEFRGVNFHLAFLVKLTQFLGIQPEESEDPNGLLSITQGEFSIASYVDSLSLEQSLLWQKMQNKPLDACDSLELSREQRNVFLQKLLQYYSYHLHDLGKLKSLAVLQEIFQ